MIKKGMKQTQSTKDHTRSSMKCMKTSTNLDQVDQLLTENLTCALLICWSWMNRAMPSQSLNKNEYLYYHIQGSIYQVESSQCAAFLRRWSDDVTGGARPAGTRRRRYEIARRAAARPVTVIPIQLLDFIVLWLDIDWMHLFNYLFYLKGPVHL